MTEKKGWEKSTTGPDWVDVEMMLRSLSGLHSGHGAVSILPFGTGSSGGLSVACTMRFDVLPGSSLPSGVITESNWPCTEHSSLAAHVFAGLHDLDYEISKVYRNEKFWK